jgi:hypothetical protein
MLTAERVRALLDYDPETGRLTWRERDMDWWNAKHAGREAGVTDKQGYRVLSIDDRMYRAHRVIWLWAYGVLPDLLDHKNRDRADNRLKNLRPATPSLNAANSGMRRTNRLRVKGVHFDPRRGQYMAQISINYRKFNLGGYRTVRQAEQAYRAVERIFSAPV